MIARAFRNFTFAFLVGAALFAGSASAKASPKELTYQFWLTVFSCPEEDDGIAGWFGVVCDAPCDTSDMQWRNYFEEMTVAACEDYCDDWSVNWVSCWRDDSSIYEWNTDDCITSCECLCMY